MAVAVGVERVAVLPRDAVCPGSLLVGGAAGAADARDREAAAEGLLADVGADKAAASKHEEWWDSWVCLHGRVCYKDEGGEEGRAANPASSAGRQPSTWSIAAMLHGRVCVYGNALTGRGLWGDCNHTDEVCVLQERA